MKTVSHFSQFVFSIALLTLLILPIGQASAAHANTVSLVFRSAGANDGSIIESTELSNVGGTIDASSTTFSLGDDATDRQARAILHFNTASIPDTATITMVKLKIKRQGLVGTNPFTTHGKLILDMRKPFFGGSAALAAADFQAGAVAPAGKLNAGQFSSTPISGGKAYLVTLPASSFQFINKAGVTQFRLRFTLDDNDDNSADAMLFFSGNSILSERPELEVQYIP
jgi:hypothetical protein